MLSMTKRHEFDYGHRVPGHQGKCRNYHGHRGVVDITCRGVMPSDGMVLDFGIVKSIVGSWIDEHWDHAMLLHKGDPLVEWLEMGKHYNPSRSFVLEVPPTAEWLAVYLYYKANDLLHLSMAGITVTNIRFYETPTCWSDFDGAMRLPDRREGDGLTFERIVHGEVLRPMLGLPSADGRGPGA
jgi:6-pyruvoyltetrahydropterin/6-carboxytetrahydropterin synthase